MTDTPKVAYWNDVPIGDCSRDELLACVDWITRDRFGPYVYIKEPVPKPVEMILHCPDCGERHLDEGEWADKPHSTHACQHCGFVWRPAIDNTVGVQFLEGFQNKPTITLSEAIKQTTARDAYWKEVLK